MKPSSQSLLVLALAAFATPAYARGPVKVVATLPDLARIAQAIGGDDVRVTTIASGIQDPHFVDPKPSYVVKLRDADLFLVSGLQLEIGWVPPLLEGARNPDINIGTPGYIDCSIGIPVLEVPTGEVNRAQGDVHPLGNPHYLVDPLNGQIVAGTIAAALSRVDPDHAAQYEARRKAFSRSIADALFGKGLVDDVGESKLERLARSGELDGFLKKNGLTAKLGGWLAKMRPYQGTKIVFYHRSYSYFAARFGIMVVDYVELKPGIQPGPGHLADLVAHMRKEKIPLLGTHAFYDEKIAQLVADKGGAKLVVFPLSSGGIKGADDYLKLFDVIVGQFQRALGS